MKNYSPYFEEDIFEVMKIESCLDSKNVDCGTNKKQVANKIKSGLEKIKDIENNLKKLKSRTPDFNEIIQSRSSFEIEFEKAAL